MKIKLFVFGIEINTKYMRKSNIEFEQVISRGCGLDVHHDTVVATVMGKGIKTENRTFGTTLRNVSWQQRKCRQKKVQEHVRETND